MRIDTNIASLILIVVVALTAFFIADWAFWANPQAEIDHLLPIHVDVVATFVSIAVGVTVLVNLDT